LKNNKEETVDI